MHYYWLKCKFYHTQPNLSTKILSTNIRSFLKLHNLCLHKKVVLSPNLSTNHSWHHLKGLVKVRIWTLITLLIKQNECSWFTQLVCFEHKSKQFRTIITKQWIKLYFDFDVKLKNLILKGAGTYLQPHYGNGVFGNVYLSAEQH